jgi:hypothetical protein
MATTVPKAFSEFAELIKPTAGQETTISSRREAVRNFMLSKYDDSSNMPLRQTKVIGSAGRKTLIRPVEDIDIFCVFDGTKVWSSYQNNSQQLLYRVREALDGYSVRTIGSRGQAVRLFYSDGFNVDITPAFQAVDWLNQPDGYIIPRGDGQWQKTNPYVHGDFMARRNEELGYNLKPLVRLLKRWNDVHSKRLRSFHLELIAQATFGSLGSNMRAATKSFFEWAPSYPHVSDPAGYSGDMAASLTNTQVQNILGGFSYGLDHAQRALDAEAEGRTAEALRQWGIVFGPGFPSYG